MHNSIKEIASKVVRHIELSSSPLKSYRCDLRVPKKSMQTLYNFDEKRGLGNFEPNFLGIVKFNFLDFLPIISTGQRQR